MYTHVGGYTITLVFGHLFFVLHLHMCLTDVACFFGDASRVDLAHMFDATQVHRLLELQS